MTTIQKISMLLFVTFFSTFTLKAQVPNKAEDISPLLIGEKLPNATLKNAEGKTVKLHTLLSEKPTVLVFYRGGWCPYCNLQLSGLATAEEDILRLGYQIIAISPDDYQNLQHTAEKDSIKYTLLSDKDGAFMQEIGIAFKTPLMVKGYVSTKGQKGETSDAIPVPTVMVVGTDSSILFEYINPNYKIRISEELLIAVLKTLKTSK